MQILPKEQARSFDSPPEFTHLERKKYFNLNQVEKDYLNTLRQNKIKVFFVLTLGCFKASGKYYSEGFKLKDQTFVREKLDCKEVIDLLSISRFTQSQIHDRILKLTGYSKYTQEAETLVTQTVLSMMKSQPKPTSIFAECLEVLSRHRIELPTYRSLADSIYASIKQYELQSAQILDSRLSKEQAKLLDDLLIAQNSSAPTIVKLKTFYQENEPGKIRLNLELFSQLQHIHSQLLDLTKLFDFSENGWQYFADCTINFRTEQLQRRVQNQKYLYLLAFSVNQFRKLHDHLAVSLIKSVDSNFNSAVKTEQKLYFEQKELREKALQKISKEYDNKTALLGHIKTIIFDLSLDSKSKLDLLQEIFKFQKEDKLEEFEELEKLKPDSHKIIEDKSLSLQHRVSEILKVSRMCFFVQ